MSTFKKHHCLNVTYRNIFVNNTKTLHTDNNVKKLKILKALYIKFRQPPINRINFESNDNILKCFKIDGTIRIAKDQTNFILLHLIEMFKNKLPLPLSITSR